MGVPQTAADTNQNAMSPAPSLDLDDTRRGVSQQDIDALKQMAVSVLSESLFKKILEINQVGGIFDFDLDLRIRDEGQTA